MLENVKLRPNYNSYDNDIVSEFYNPVLRCCNRYDRATAYFSAKSIANISEGIALLYKNAGKNQFKGHGHPLYFRGCGGQRRWWH